MCIMLFQLYMHVRILLKLNIHYAVYNKVMKWFEVL